MKLNEFLTLSEILVKELTEQINLGEKDLKEAEEKILKFIYKIGHEMLKKVIGKIAEPTVENKLEVNGKVAVYKDMQNLRFKNRFGEEIVRKRRRYKIEGEA